MKKLTLLLAALALVIAACGGNDDPFGAAATSSTAAAPTTTVAEETTTTEADDDETTTTDDGADTTVAPSTTEPPATTIVDASNVLADAVVNCLGGDDVACDIAYMISDINSEDEEIGETCGGRGLPDDQLFCSGYDFDSTADDYGDDPLLDALWDLCTAGSEDTCLALWEWAPEGSGYETYAEGFIFPGGDDDNGNGGDGLDLGDLPPIDVAGMNSCEALADGAITMFQAFIDIIDTLDMDDFEQITGDEDIFIQADDVGMQMEDRAVELGCSDEEIEALILAGADQLTAESFFGQLIIDGILEDGGLDFGG